jgi:hypothetical protein
MSKTIPVGKTPKIEIDNIHGDLSIVGWEGEDILIKADEDELHCQQDGERIRLSCDGDLALRVPKAASISVGSTGGDMSLRSLTGGIELKEAGRDLSVRDVNSVSIDSVHGDFSLRGAKGNLLVKNIQGDASVRAVVGNISLESVSDDLALRDVRGSLKVKVGEDVVLYLRPQPGNTYEVTAGDDILLVLPSDADASLTMQGDVIEMDWPGVMNDEEATIREVTLGSGSANINLNAGGEVRVTNQADAGDWADEFGNFAGINFDWSGFGDRLSKRVEHHARRAEKTARSAARRFERQVNRNAQRWNVNWTANSPASTPQPDGEPVSEQERMAILKMLQEKKITAEQADKLLAALEGG